ncbi:MAG: hypothetical protein NWF01_09100 [Candidatus Bathyarchaeota archaeon]|nr:hypothetical protein [Candidatus Bathyarchaeota archaeon]
MHYKKALTTATLIALIVLAAFSASAFATQLAMGVEVGDYAEYTVDYTGTPWEGHDATWARMDIVRVDGLQVDVNFTTRLTDDSIVTAYEQLDFSAGKYIDYFVISSGLKKGDSFFDSGINGTVTIQNQEVKNYAGVDRTVISGVTSHESSEGTATTTWYWDQKTGIALEAISDYPQFTMHTTIEKTNRWTPPVQPDTTNLAIFIIVFVGIVVAIYLLNLFFKKKKITTFSFRSRDKAVSASRF